jgi:hypothetical protein
LSATFQSADGTRSQGVFADPDEAIRLRDADAAYAAHLEAILGIDYQIVEFGPVKEFQAIGDLPMHYNNSLGEVVRGRRHLRQLQRDTDSVDYEPTAKQKERDAVARDRMKFELARR